jgi:hypothetical protein
MESIASASYTKQKHFKCTHFWITGDEIGVPVYIKTMQSCSSTFDTSSRSFQRQDVQEVHAISCFLCIIFKFRKWHTCNYEWYSLYRSYENCRRPSVAILDMQMSKVPIISGYAWGKTRGVPIYCISSASERKHEIACTSWSSCLWKLRELVSNVEEQLCIVFMYTGTPISSPVIQKCVHLKCLCFVNLCMISGQLISDFVR